MFIMPSCPLLPTSLSKSTKSPSSYTKIVTSTSWVNTVFVMNIAGGILKRWSDYEQRRK